MLQRPQCKAIAITVALVGSAMLAAVGGVLEAFAPHGVGGLFVKMPVLAVAVVLVLGGFNALCDYYERWLGMSSERRRVTAVQEFVPSDFERRELNAYRSQLAASWPKA